MNEGNVDTGCKGNALLIVIGNKKGVECAANSDGQ